MNKQCFTGKIPLVIGAVGQPGLSEKDSSLLRETVKGELKKLQANCPHTPIVMLCALTGEADALCADAAADEQIPLWAALPMERRSFAACFPAEERERLEYHLNRAEKVYTVQAAECPPVPLTREFCYRQAGIHIAEHSQILLVLWNGKEDKNGWDTPAAANILLEGKWQPERGAVSRSGENAAVIQVTISCKEETEENIGAVRLLGNWSAMEDILKKTEEFNVLAEQTETDGDPLLPKGAGNEPSLRRFEALYHTADSLSIRFAKEYRKILAGLAATGTLLTLAFLMYDERNMIPLILLCGAMLICAFLLSGKAERSACHRRYIEYRALAEAIRVQMFLRYAGSKIEAQRLMTWTQQMETAWILCTVCAMNAEQPPEKKRGIRECWAQDQQMYHRRAGEKTGRRNEGNDRLVRAILLCSAAAYLLTLFFELLSGGLIFRPLIRIENPEEFRTSLKIILGTLSAGTLFLSSYYGKMSLERRSSDHRKMETFFRIMSERLAEQGQTESLMETLAREELAENGNWCSYRRDHKPELDL